MHHKSGEGFSTHHSLWKTCRITQYKESHNNHVSLAVVCFDILNSVGLLACIKAVVREGRGGGANAECTIGHKTRSGCFA